MKIGTIGGSLYVVLPKAIVAAKEWHVGDHLECKLDGKGNILLLRTE